jgi:hypothetical protein
VLGQDAWQLGPEVGATLLGKRFIAHGFVPQWFKIGGSRRDTNQMNGVFNYTYSVANGWTIGTQPSLSINRKAPSGEGGRSRSDRRSEGSAPAPACRRAAGAVSVLHDSSRHDRPEVEHATAGDADYSRAHQEAVSSNDFDVLKARLGGGQFFHPSDIPGSQPVAVVNETFARVWLGGDPIEQNVAFSLGINGLQTTVGVVADVSGGGLDEQTKAAISLCCRAKCVTKC